MVQCEVMKRSKFAHKSNLSKSQLLVVKLTCASTEMRVQRFKEFIAVSILARKGRCERASIDEVYLDLSDAAEAMLAENPPESLDKIDEEALKSHILSLNEKDRSDHKDNVREWLHRSDADHLDKLLACGALIVAELRMQVLKEIEFTCSVGITHNKGVINTTLVIPRLVSANSLYEHYQTAIFTGANRKARHLFARLSGLSPWILRPTYQIHLQPLSGLIN
ncbi:unnamed protein product [Camellia sinensis]